MHAVFELPRLSSVLSLAAATITTASTVAATPRHTSSTAASSWPAFACAADVAADQTRHRVSVIVV